MRYGLQTSEDFDGLLWNIEEMVNDDRGNYSID